MKSTGLLAMIILIASVLLSACSGLGLSTSALGLGAPSKTNAQSAGAGAPLASQPVPANPQSVADVAALQNAFEAVYQSVNPSVVTIQISSKVSAATGSGGIGGQGNGQNPQGKPGQTVPVAEGSGFVWDAAGHIVTNNHVVTGADRINVTFSDGSNYDAKLVGKDPNTDLAVIQVIGAPSALLKPISVGDSTQVKVGEMVVAIGNPFGLANTMTTGIVSAISRAIAADAGNGQNGVLRAPGFSIPDVIQTDAAINPGNSGGVLVDMNGALIGVPSQIESQGGSNSGVGFAIPSAIVSQVAPQLIAKGTAAHSYLGIAGTVITPDLATMLNLKAGEQGILVESVAAGGPAEKAGLKASVVDASGLPTTAGDIITGINGKTITRFEDLVSYLFDNTQPGQSVTLNVLRSGVDTHVAVTLGTQPTN